MRHQLTAKVAPVSELFSGPSRFKLPWFQRAYAWQTQQVGRLLSDLLDAMKTLDAEHYYMVGNFMLSRIEGTDDLAIIDGHQRIVTMTILFAVLRDLEQEPRKKAALQAHISHEPDSSPATSGNYHVCPQASLADFFETFVQKQGATTVECDALAELSETERNILENREYLRDALSHKGITAQTRRNLAQFIDDACHAVVRIADNEDNAWHMLQVEEETHVDFNATDRTKASLLGAMAKEDREEASRIWDDCEYTLGSKDMFELLKAVRTLKRRRRSSAPIEKDLCTIFALNTSGRKFMEQVISPNALRMSSVREGTVSKRNAGRTLARLTGILNWTAPDLWMPAALHWLDVRGPDDRSAPAFFASLERLVTIQKIAGTETPRQESRINRLLAQIDTESVPDNMTEFTIDKSLRDKARYVLKRSFSRRKATASIVLARISVELGDDPRDFTVDHPPTIEHVLPQKPPSTSAWYERFPSDATRATYVNALGNLSLLTREENQRVGNSDWVKKKPIMSRSMYRISRAAAKAQNWTPESIDQRTDQLVGILFQVWNLPLE